MGDLVSQVTNVIGVKDAFTLWKEINQQRINSNFARSQNTINELNASATLQRLQNETVQRNEQFNNGQFNPFANTMNKKYMGYALLAAAAVAAYLLIKN